MFAGAQQLSKFIKLSLVEWAGKMKACEHARCDLNARTNWFQVGLCGCVSLHAQMICYFSGGDDDNDDSVLIGFIKS